MERVRKLFAIALMVFVLGVGAPAVLADGPSETPGNSVTGTTPDKPDPGAHGTSETPGRIVIDIITLLTNLIV
jgi:hypothetical protein